ncbi:MAG TPA: 4-(cytidine 5'-diphospho)-2-C-methyl-D-erythritol kinase [Alphaproteobacteria bacterium]|nr:4-(cytidine 5'-diphospho)-2-C-methyl-D-erythritol kinase [Alphaproteobacteria bacterium]
MLRQPAPAKLNLYLHVTGRRGDGYHELDSLVAFAGVGDEITLEPASSFSFALEGPRAEALRKEPADNNLAVRAARTLAELTGKELGVTLTLTKNLPVASGIGGGSADAAAALRALAIHWGLDAGDPRLYQAANTHGQDIAACLDGDTLYLTPGGTESGPELPHTDIVLVNPGKGLATADVYKAFRQSGAPFSPEARFESYPKDAAALAAMLRQRHNDLAAPAMKLMPGIAAILKVLAASAECLFAAMSGSGATCFGLYPDRSHARQAAAQILTAHPDWWVIQSHIPLARDRRRHF